MAPYNLTRGTGNVYRATRAKLNQLYGCSATAPTTGTAVPTAPGTVACTPSWSCGDWSACGADYKRTRACTDSNFCGALYAANKPAESEECVPNPAGTSYAPTGGDGSPLLYHATSGNPLVQGIYADAELGCVAGYKNLNGIFVRGAPAGFTDQDCNRSYAGYLPIGDIGSAGASGATGSAGCSLMSAPCPLVQVRVCTGSVGVCMCPVNYAPNGPASNPCVYVPPAPSTHLYTPNIPYQQISLGNGTVIYSAATVQIPPLQTYLSGIGYFDATQVWHSCPNNIWPCQSSTTP